MSSLRDFSADFEPQIRARGLDYHKRGAVRVKKVTDGLIQSAVEGTERYQCQVARDADGYLTYDCTCPYFSDHGGEPCKHLWATLLKVDADGRLAEFDGAEDREEEDQDVDDADVEEDDEDDEDDEDEEDGDDPRGPAPRGPAERDRRWQGGPPASPPPPAKPSGWMPANAAGTAAWKRQLLLLRQAMETRGPGPAVGPAAAAAFAWPNSRRVAYVIDVPATLEAAALTVQLCQQTLGKGGEWERPKPLKLAREHVALLPDPIDRQIVQMLLGAKSNVFDYYYAYEQAEIPRRFVLPESAYATTLRPMTETGRCLLRRTEDKESFDPTPLAWDAGEPWEFWVEVKRSPGGRNYLIDGSLRRKQAGGEGENGAEQRLGVGEAEVVLRGGLLIAGGRITGLNDFGAFDLLASLRDGLKLTVPGEQGDELLRTLFSLPQLPRLELPEELHVEESRPAPKPRVKIKAGSSRSVGDDRLVAEVSFDYGGHVFGDGGKGSHKEDKGTVFQPDARRVLHRDLRAEEAYRARLVEMGFRQGYNYMTDRSSLRLSPNKLPRVVRDLTGEGWHVEAEGKLYRQPGELKVRVSSGIDWFELHGEVSFGDTTAPLPRLLEALRRGEKSVRLNDGTFGLLPEEWLKKYGLLANLGETKDDHLRFSKRQVGFLDVLLASMPEARVDEVFQRAREELAAFKGVDAADAPSGFVGELRAYQREGLGWMNFLRRFHFGGCLADDMGLGKAQPLDAKVLTPAGWKRMGEVRVGDAVINSQGGTSRVLGVYPQGEKDIYRVTFSDGSSTECCDEHLWQVTTPVRKYRGAEPRVLPLSEIRQSLIDSSGNRRHFVPMVRPVEFEPCELPLHPYLLGVLLSDGGIAHRVILSSADAELVEHAAELVPAGVSIRYSGQGVDYRIRSPYRGVRNAVAEELRGLGLMGCRSEAKFVPEAYKFASIGDRVELLRGLLDTDGHVRPADNNVEFCTVSPHLAQDVQFLVQSLGGTAPIRTKRTSGQLAYRMSIALPPDIVPFRLRRKAEVYHPRAKYPPGRAIVAVDYVGRKPAQCIRVDAPDHLYVTDDFIVTHNTVQVLALLESRRQLRNGAAEDATAAAAPAPAKNGKAAKHAAPSGKPGPSLVVVPKSLVFNWKQEAAKFTPAMRVLDHTGIAREKEKAGHFEQFDLILTTYGTLRRDAELFKDVAFDYVVLDEAQAIKNAASGAAKAARLLRADHRLALSGTPVQNHLGELWSLFEFLNPGMLGAASVFKMTASSMGTSIDAESREVLSRALRPFILRRTKQQVARDLPEKLEQTLFCELEPAQRKQYDELRAHYRQALLERIARDGMNKAKIEILEALLRLRQAACHPGLIDKARSSEPSAKLDALLEQIGPVLEENHKVLVFSQFTSLLAIVRQRLDAEQVPYEYLDGQTRDRQSRVERFQTDPNCKLFLISLKAGGLGLNLTAAEYVFLLDPWWNPAVEAQAIDRAHRIGQTRRVFAYRLIARDTVEEKVLALQQTKRELADAIISADNSVISKLGREDLELLLS